VKDEQARIEASALELHRLLCSMISTEVIQSESVVSLREPLETPSIQSKFKSFQGLIDSVTEAEYILFVKYVGITAFLHVDCDPTWGVLFPTQDYSHRLEYLESLVRQLNEPFLNPSDPTILLQSLITSDLKSDSGILVQAVNVPWKKILIELRRDPNFLTKLPPRHLEELIAASYHLEGYEVTLTPQSGDGGVDVIAEKKGQFAIRVLDQVKRYNAGHIVTAKEVSALVANLTTDFGATHAVVTTTSDFAPKILEYPPIKKLSPDRLLLVNGTALVERLRALSLKP
jgi:restriction system protein